MNYMKKVNSENIAKNPNIIKRIKEWVKDNSAAANMLVGKYGTIFGLLGIAIVGSGIAHIVTANSREEKKLEAERQFMRDVENSRIRRENRERESAHKLAMASLGILDE